MIAPDRLPGIRGALSYLEKANAQSARRRRVLWECLTFALALGCVGVLLCLALSLVALAAG